MEGGGKVEEIFFGRGLDGKRGVNSWSGGSRFLQIAIIDFKPLLLFDLLFTCRLKDLSLVICHLYF